MAALGRGILASTARYDSVSTSVVDQGLRDGAPVVISDVKQSNTHVSVVPGVSRSSLRVLTVSSRALRLQKGVSRLRPSKLLVLSSFNRLRVLRV